MSLPASYGDVTAEYLALRRGAGIVLDAHDVVWVRGGDAVSFLDGLVSQSVDPMAPGTVARSLLLTPQGKLDVPHHILRGEDVVALVTQAGKGEQLAASLNRFKIRVVVTLDLDPRPSFAVWGPEARIVVARVSGSSVPEPGEWLETDGIVVADLPLIHGHPPRFLVLGADPDDAVESGGTLVGGDAVSSVSIERGEPALGSDVDESTIPEEAGLVTDAVDFTKGCFLGQELVARIDSRGRVTKHLRGLKMEANVIPPRDAVVESGGEAVGILSTVGESLELRAPIALAMVRHEVVPGDHVVVAWDGGSTTALVASLPMA